MDLSVVVPTLNGRDRLGATLDALAAEVPEAEVVVVNGPSADGTTGMVRDRADVDVLVEVSTRTLNVARNAGIDAAAGDAVAFVGYDLTVETGWGEAVREGLRMADVVTGPTTRGGDSPEGPERIEIAGRDVTYFAGDNVAFGRPALDALDGFDEYLETGGARDAAHRLATLGYDVRWRPGARATATYGSDGGERSLDGDLRWKYRALAYRMVKNYGPRPTVFVRLLRHAGVEGAEAFRGLLRGDVGPSAWLGNGRNVAVGSLIGLSDGAVARARDRSRARNPHGVSTRADRAVARYEADGGDQPRP
jgi:glycosyltransferase involved in cell wall biosynthesis